jgi:radical SAM protein with 4Fe4S-binding SPASM domain
MIQAKFSITTECGAKCATCPSWKQPQRTMDIDTFLDIWKKLNDEPAISSIMINGTGDITAVEGWEKYLEAALPFKKKHILMTTNGAYLENIPAVVDTLVISFNGGTPETYRKTTGLDFDAVAQNIRKLYPQMERLGVEIHCLIWKGNEGDAAAFIDFWEDFPGKRRISYKAENQGGEYFGIMPDDHRVPCDYLNKLCIEYDGHVAACNHDWKMQSNFGDLKTQSITDVMNHPDRRRMVDEHLKHQFTGICEKCNYNVASAGKVAYV